MKDGELKMKYEEARRGAIIMVDALVSAKETRGATARTTSFANSNTTP